MRPTYAIRLVMSDGSYGEIMTMPDYSVAVWNAKRWRLSGVPDVVGGEVLKRPDNLPHHAWELVHVYPLPVRTGEVAS